MMDRDGPRSNPYRPSPDACCEACVFGRGEHAEWCWPCLGCGARLDLWTQWKVAHSQAACKVCGFTFTTTRRSLELA